MASFSASSSSLRACCHSAAITTFGFSTCSCARRPENTRRDHREVRATGLASCGWRRARVTRDCHGQRPVAKGAGTEGWFSSSTTALSSAVEWGDGERTLRSGNVDVVAP